MARVVFELPDQLGFSTEVQVYISHVNQGGHLDNAQLLSLVSEARVRFFQNLGYAEADVAGVSTVVGDIVSQYKSEAFHGETLRVSMGPADFNPYGFDLLFHMVEVSQQREVARGKIGIVFIDQESRRPTAIPAAVHQSLLKV